MVSQEISSSRLCVMHIIIELFRRFLMVLDVFKMKNKTMLLAQTICINFNRFYEEIYQLLIRLIL